MSGRVRCRQRQSSDVWCVELPELSLLDLLLLYLTVGTGFRRIIDDSMRCSPYQPPPCTEKYDPRSPRDWRRFAIALITKLVFAQNAEEAAVSIVQVRSTTKDGCLKLCICRYLYGIRIPIATSAYHCVKAA
jgi:hypothetical protein